MSRSMMNDGALKVNQEKTGTLVYIPLRKQALELLPKEPFKITNQYYNRALKDISKVAGIEKWQEVSSHTARRSFSTNAYLAGVPTLSIMKITGHNTEAAFLLYIQIDAEQHAKHISSHPFFS